MKKQKYVLCYYCRNIFPASIYVNKTPVCQNCYKKGLRNPTNKSKMSKEIKDKIRQTNLERYGVESHNQSPLIKQKKKETSLKHYGVDNPNKSQIVKDKIKQTNLKKYGVEWITQSSDFQTKSKQTNLRKYGVENYSQTIQFRQFAKTIKKDFNKIAQKNRENFINNKLPILLKYLDLELLDEYIDPYSKMRFKCLKCHQIFVNSWDNVQQYFRCPKCFPRKQNHISKAEIEILDFLKSIYPHNIQSNCRTIISPKELDVYMPDINLAIEYHGLFWHSDYNNIDIRNEHLNKLILCQQQNIRLIQIFEDEWLFKQDIVKERLKHIIGIGQNKIRIHARKCIIDIISPTDKNDFLKNNHIQGADGSQIKLGAFYDNQLLAVMTFSKPSISKGYKNKNDNIWELNRFAVKIGYHIPGIASRLLSYFIKHYKWREIFSYADLRWSDGNLYNQLGFEFEKQTPPNYWYVDFKNGKRVHRFVYRKRKDEPANIPEWALRRKEGLYRIWDCGNLKFVLKNRGFVK